MKTWMKWAIGAVVLVILAVTAGPFIYINFIKEDAPDEFTLPSVNASASTVAASTTAGGADTTAAAPTAATDATTATTTATTAAASESSAAPSAGDGIDGSWSITDGSQVGYRVVEVLFGQDTEGVGRTTAVTGSIEIAGTQVTAGSFEVDMATVESDESRRDNQFRGRLLETDEFPTSTFTLTAPIELGAVPANGEPITATATGDLTLHGVTRPVTFDVQAQLNGELIQIVGSTDIVFADYDIEQPDSGGVTTQNHGTLEFSLNLATV